MPELKHGMLLAAGGMFNGQVHDGQLPPYKPARARVELNSLDGVFGFTFEHIHGPWLIGWRFAGFRWFVILEHDILRLRPVADGHLVRGSGQ